MFNRKSDPKPIDTPASFSTRTEPTTPPATSATAHNDGISDFSAATSAPPDTGTSVIGSNFSIEGQSITIRCQGSLHVNGNIHADLHCQELVVGDAAVITGAITADKVSIHGKVGGAVRGQHVTLHDQAEVEGDIHSQFLAIEPGASFDGRSRKVKDPSEVTPQLNAPHADGSHDHDNGAVVVPSAQASPGQDFSPTSYNQ